MADPTPRQLWRDAIRDSDDPALDVYAVAVAMALDRHMSADGRTRTGVRKLGRLARVNKDTVTERIDRLAAAGWLEVEHAGRGAAASYGARMPTQGVSDSTGQSVSDMAGHPAPWGNSEVSDPTGRVSDSVGPVPIDPVDPEESAPATPSITEAFVAHVATPAHRLKAGEVDRAIADLRAGLSERTIHEALAAMNGTRCEYPRHVVEHVQAWARRHGGQRPACDNPNCAAGWVLDDGNVAHPCPTCNAQARAS